MSLLNETILYFFPGEAHKCAFIEEPWFKNNYSMQLNVVRLCYEGYSKMIEMSYNEERFSDHISQLLHILDESENDYDFLDDIITGIGCGDYLLWRSWFRNSSFRQLNILLIKIHGYSHWINAVAGDFDDHIDSVMQKILKKMRMERDAVLAGELYIGYIQLPRTKVRSEYKIKPSGTFEYRQVLNLSPL